MVRKDAIQRFADAARQHGVQNLEGDAKAANRAYKSIIVAVRELREAPDKGVSLFAGLLSDDDLSIVTWAALFLLPFDEAKASDALHKVADSGVRLLALSARMTLSEWHAGRLHIE